MEPRLKPEFIFSCEHAGNKIPGEYHHLFKGEEDTLDTHRGWDRGALNLANNLSEGTNSPLFSYPYSRLFIDLNRSIGHSNLFSEFTKGLSKSEKDDIIEIYYRTYRDKVIEMIQDNHSKRIPTIHIGIHTFTPILNGKHRKFEIGLLFDPSRRREKEFCKKWKSSISKAFPDYRILMNKPYKGVSDGFTTFLRKTFDPNYYLGIELEVNQNLVENENDWSQFCSKFSHNFKLMQMRYEIT